MKKRTHDEYISLVMKSNPNISVIGTYVDAHTKILHKCLNDNVEWYVTPNNILKGCGCPKCGRMSSTAKRSKSHEEYVYEVANIDKNIAVVGKYINSQLKVLHRCLIDNFEWEALPNNILNGERCPRCSRKERYTTDSFKDRMVAIDNTIIICGEYMGCKEKILCECSVDGHKWKATPSNLLYGFGCPICNSSHGEKNISKYLTNNEIDFIPQYTFLECRSVKLLPFDFYLPKYNVCIEYDGIQHFEPIDFFGGEEEFRKRKKNDSIKNVFCKNNGIVLLRIKYDQDIDMVLHDFFNTLTIQINNKL